jgi:hypothetical protein
MGAQGWGGARGQARLAWSVGRTLGPGDIFLSPGTLSDIYYKKETEFVAPIVSYNKSTYLGAWA